MQDEGVRSIVIAFNFMYICVSGCDFVHLLSACVYEKFSCLPLYRSLEMLPALKNNYSLK